ncbi:MAG TPA: DUF2298 domain-containing protein, partial [Anaerolineae bacterium]|nr:DUF2298 domain-containing protein [Anaerolineae bacterium]
YYDAQGLAKFEDMVGTELQIAYRQGPVTIYRVEGSGAREVGRTDESPPTVLQGLRDWVGRQWVPGRVRAEGPVPSPTDAALQRSGPSLMLDRPVDQLPILRDRGWNRVARDATVAAVAIWWLVLQLIGLAAWPLVACVCSRLGDSGYGLAKGIGLLVVSYLVWIGSSLRLVANSPPVAWLALAFLAGVSLVLWRVRRCDLAAVWKTNRRIILIEEGLFAVAFLAFVGLRLLNPDLWHPFFGGEKMMEIAFLNALTKSAYMPPYDPFFAGGYVNYYYYGHFMVALLVKLTGVTPEVGFNLAVPTFFGLTILHCFMVGYWMVEVFGPGRRLSEVEAPASGDGRAGLVASRAMSQTVAKGECGKEWARGGGVADAVGCRRPEMPRADAIEVARLSPACVWAGVSAAALVAAAANMSAVVQLLEGLGRIGGASFSGRITWDDLSRVVSGLGLLLRGKAEMPAFDYWYRATRIIPYTINEFPFFGFLFADLHPHVIGIPFTVLVVALFVVLIRDDVPHGVDTALRWSVVAVAVGALGVINTWDLPTYLGGLGCVLVYRGFRSRGLRGIVVGAITSLAVAALSLALYSPFYLGYRPPDLSLALVPPADRTHLSRFVTIWGLQLFLVISLVGVWAVRDRPWRRLLRLGRRAPGQSLCSSGRSRRAVALRWVLSLATLVLITALVWLLRDMLVIVLLAALLAFAGVLLLASGRNETIFLQRLMLFIGLGILLGVEVVYVRDWLAESEWRRMNTVFKFYVQAWVLIGLAIGAALPDLWRRIVRRRHALAPAWVGALGLLVFSSALYPVMAIPARVGERFPGAQPPIGTLNGTAYMRTAIYGWPDGGHRIELKYDREAIEWLLRNVEATPVIAEAPLGYYREGGLRVSAYTGLPTIVGAHEREQRPMDQVSAREDDAAELYHTTDTGAMLGILRRYRVKYVYVGQLERNVYPGPGLTKFDDLTKAGMLARVFHNDGVDIYEVLCDWDAGC